MGRDSLATAAWHSLLARIDEARRAAALPSSMRVDAAQSRLITIGETIDAMNATLAEEGKTWQLARDHVSSQQAVLAHAAQLHGVA